MGAISIVKGFLLDSFNEATNRFDNYKFIYLGLLAVNIAIRLPSAHLGYDSSNIFYFSSVSILLQVIISILTARLIITKMLIENHAPQKKILRAILRYLKGQLLYYIAAGAGLLLLVIPGLLAIFFLYLSPALEVLEEHRGIGALKRSYALIKKDIPVVFILFFIAFVMNVILEIIFSRLRNSIPGVMIYFLSALLLTFISVIVTLTSLRLINYLKELVVVVPDSKY